MADCTLEKMTEMGTPKTARNYVALAYWDRTLESLEGEELVQVLSLVDAGEITMPENYQGGTNVENYQGGTNVE